MTLRNAAIRRQLPVARMLFAVVAVCAGLGAAPQDAQAQKRSATLVFGQEAPPPTLDPHFSTSIATRNVAMHIFEQLVTRDENNDVIPELAQNWEISPDGLTYTFRIRSGVTVVLHTPAGTAQRWRSR